MLKDTICLAALAGCLVISSAAHADPWKDESGHRRGGPPPWAGRGGEPPDWARGKGVWDGHLEHRRFGGPPPWAGRGRDFDRRRYGRYGHGWRYDDDYGRPRAYRRYYEPRLPYRYRLR